MKGNIRNMNENKINFFKKIWYSIAKPSKYFEMNKQDLTKTIRYFFAIVCILALSLSIIVSLIQSNIVNEAINCLDEKLPEIKFKENILSLENEDAIILDDKKIMDYFTNPIVINTLLSKDEAIEQYKDIALQNNKVIIFLKEEFVLISDKYNPENEKEGIEAHKYSDVSSNFIKDTKNEYGKKDILNYLRQRTPITYYIAQFFVIYFITISFLFFIYIILIATSVWLVTKGFKLKWTYKESLSNTIYASTLSMFAYVMYMIISYFTKFKFAFMDVVCMAIIFIYLYIILMRQKKENKKT